MSQPTLGVVLPAYREEQTIGALLKALSIAVPEASFLVVDDSPDEATVQAAEATGLSTLQVLHREGKGGRGTAVLEGMRRLIDQGCDYVVEMDTDLSHPPADVPALLRAASERDLDLVIASRYVSGGKIEGWPMSRHLLSATANRVARLTLRIPVRDYTTGFRLYSRRACEAILDECGDRGAGFIALSEILVAVYFRGLSVGEIPSTFTNRTLGDSTMGWKEIVGGAAGLARVWRMKRAIRRDHGLV